MKVLRKRVGKSTTGTRTPGSGGGSGLREPASHKRAVPASNVTALPTHVGS